MFIQVKNLVKKYYGWGTPRDLKNYLKKNV